MELINDVSDVLHKIRVRLYPNYLKARVDGEYIARTNSEATLSVEEVCSTLIKRGGYTGSFEDLVRTVKMYENETVYQLCNGYIVKNRFYSLIPGVGGTFDSAAEANDREAHPITFTLQERAALKRLARKIRIKVDGIAENTAWIDKFTDVTTNTVNETLTPGGMFVIHGNKIKVLGDDPGVGVYFESQEDEGKRIKADAVFAENTRSKIIGTIPTLVIPRTYRLVIVSQYSGGNNLLKVPRVIAGKFTLSIE